MISAAKSPIKTTPLDAPPATEPESDMDVVVSLLSERAGYAHRLAQLQIDAEQYLQMFARTVQREHTDLTEGIAEIEADVERICRSHPEWFATRRSIPTPFGTPKLTSSTSLDVPDEPRTIELVQEKHRRRSMEFIRLVPELNLPALAELNDEQLLEIGIVRRREDKFSIAAATVALGKAVKALTATKEGK